MALMATAIDESADAALYADLAQRSAKFMDETLFNGDYFQQKVNSRISTTSRLPSPSRTWMTRAARCSNCSNVKGRSINMASGCLSDGVIGAWMARLYGIDTPLAEKNVRSTLQSIFRNNFKTDLSQHANCAAPGLCIGPRAGFASMQLAARQQTHASLRLLRRSVDRDRIRGRIAPDP